VAWDDNVGVVSHVVTPWLSLSSASDCKLSAERRNILPKQKAPPFDPLPYTVHFCPFGRPDPDASTSTSGFGIGDVMSRPDTEHRPSSNVR
jgi:hypothetical protein